MILHLSLLRPPAPRPHHRRIARAILQDAAQRHDGQVFTLRNGDIALLCLDSGLSDASPGSIRPWVGPNARRQVGNAVPDRIVTKGARPPLAEALSRLLRIDAIDPDGIVSIWPLDRDHGRLLAYATARAEERLGDPPDEDEPATAPGFVEEIGTLVAAARIHDLMQGQTAVILRSVEDRTEPQARAFTFPANQPSGTVRPMVDPAAATTALQPLYREVTFSISALEARISAAGRTAADPFLFRHLAGQLDLRMLDLVADQMGRGGPLDLANTARGASPLHLNLTLGAILSSSFAAFVAACRKAGATPGIEISLIEACADSRAFAHARATVKQAGMALVLDGVSHLAMLLTAPWLLRPDLLKMDWSPRLADLPHGDEGELAAAIEITGPHRIILHRAETEAAVRWGMSHGIRRFQGRHVDAMLGAGRIMSCGHSAGCALRQCIERAGAIGPAARAACANHALLDGLQPRGETFPSERPAPAPFVSFPEAARPERPTAECQQSGSGTAATVLPSVIRPNLIQPGAIQPGAASSMLAVAPMR